MDATAIAARIVHMAADAGDRIDHLKLQKLCYYAQGYSLALWQKPIFDDRIEAWEHGPVVPAVYHQYKEHGRISIPATGEKPELEQWRIEVLEMIYARLGWMTSWNLRNQTHMERPWHDVWRRDERGGEISRRAIYEFFNGELLGQRAIPPPVDKDAVRAMLENDVELQQRVARRRGQPTSPVTF